jgi:protein-tyrosine phosphatase
VDTAVVEVEVEPDGRGGLLVRWVLDGPPAEVDVAVGATPESIDHRHAERVGADRTETTVVEPGPGRHYVSVAPAAGGSAVVAGERRLPFEGVHNFRDLGGYRVAGGGRTRWGRVFRADALHYLTTADRVAFDRLGLRVVYDLRGDLEIERKPNPVPSVQLSVVGHAPVVPGETIQRFSAEVRAAEDGARWLRDLYLGMLDHAAPVFGRLLGGLVDPEGVPAVFHCAGGKDRTGMSAALLLLVLGVDEETVLDDYELTGRYRTVEVQGDSLQSLLSSGLSPEAAAGVLSTPRFAMADALVALRERHGGVEAFLTGPAGLDGATLDELRRTLVT